MFTKRFRVYGLDGHRQRESFGESFSWDESRDGYIRKLEVLNSDKTGTNEYTDLIITRNTEEECDDEFEGQLTDGVFENSRVGRWEVIK